MEDQGILTTQKFENPVQLFSSPEYTLEGVLKYESKTITSVLRRNRGSSDPYYINYPSLELFLKKISQSNCTEKFVGGLNTSSADDRKLSTATIFYPFIKAAVLHARSNQVKKQMICIPLANTNPPSIAQLINIVESKKPGLNDMYKNKILFTIFPKSYSRPHFSSAGLIHDSRDIIIVYDTTDKSFYITTIHDLQKTIGSRQINEAWTFARKLYYVDPNILQDSTTVSWLDGKTISTVENDVKEIFTSSPIKDIVDIVMQAAEEVVEKESNIIDQLTAHLLTTNLIQRLHESTINLLMDVVWFATIQAIAICAAAAYKSHPNSKDITNFFTDNILNIIESALKNVLTEVHASYEYPDNTVLKNTIRENTVNAIFLGLSTSGLYIYESRPNLPIGGRRKIRKNKITTNTHRPKYKKTKKIRLNKHSNHKKRSKNIKLKRKKSKKSVRT